MFHINFGIDPVLDRRYEVIHGTNIRTFDDFLARCKDANLFPETVLIQQFEQHGRFLPELAKRGSEVAPRNDPRWSNMLVCACMNVNLECAKVAVAMGAGQGTPISGNLLQMAVVFGRVGFNNHRPTYDLIRYIASIRPNDLIRGESVCPLDTAICLGVLGVARLLVELGCQIDSTSMATCIDRISTDSLDAIGMVDCCMYLVAMGGRVAKGFKPVGSCDRGMSVYLNALDRVVRSRNVAMVVLGLARVGGRIQGNGRDALRLVAKEVWMSRMDEGWER